MGVPMLASLPFLHEYFADLPLRDFRVEPAFAPADARIAFHREALRQATSNIDPAMPSPAHFASRSSAG